MENTNLISRFMTIAFLIIFLTGVTYGQSIVTTYHDFLTKTKKADVYQVDANGVKNGWYKYYREDGF